MVVVFSHKMFPVSARVTGSRMGDHSGFSDKYLPHIHGFKLTAFLLTVKNQLKNNLHTMDYVSMG